MKDVRGLPVRPPLHFVTDNGFHNFQNLFNGPTKLE